MNGSFGEGGCVGGGVGGYHACGCGDGCLIV